MSRYKTKTYEITDPKALYEAAPHLFGYVPDHARIKAALKAGFNLPGLQLIPTPIEEAINAKSSGE